MIMFLFLAVFPNYKIQKVATQLGDVALNDLHRIADQWAILDYDLCIGIWSIFVFILASSTWHAIPSFVLFFPFLVTIEIDKVITADPAWSDELFNKLDMESGCFWMNETFYLSDNRYRGSRWMLGHPGGMFLPHLPHAQ